MSVYKGRQQLKLVTPHVVFQYQLENAIQLVLINGETASDRLHMTEQGRCGMQSLYIFVGDDGP
jgi:hypothetical protein